MASWTLVPCLVTLRSEFNAIAPKRDKTSDGDKGDDAHSRRSSDHNPDETGNVPIHDADKVNEVHAIDVDEDLKLPGVTMERVVQFLLGRCRTGKERRLRYIIYERRIWEASNDWKQEPYHGSNPHDHHAHFSASYNSAHEALTASWHLIDLIKKEETKPMAVTSTEMDQIAAKVVTALCTKTPYGSGGGDASPVGRAVLDSDYPAAPGASRTDLWANLQAMAEKLNAQAADLAACKSLLLQLTQDPSEPGHPVVEAVRFANANPS